MSISAEELNHKLRDAALLGQKADIATALDYGADVNSKDMVNIITINMCAYILCEILLFAVISLLAEDVTA